MGIPQEKEKKDNRLILSPNFRHSPNLIADTMNWFLNSMLD